jgi:hypothetical protein
MAILSKVMFVAVISIISSVSGARTYCCKTDIGAASVDTVKQLPHGCVKNGDVAQLITPCIRYGAENGPYRFNGLPSSHVLVARDCFQLEPAQDCNEAAWQSLQDANAAAAAAAPVAA